MPRPKPLKPPKQKKAPPRPSTSGPLTNSNATLWANLVALMGHKWNEVNQSRLAREADTSPGNIARIKKQGTNNGIKLIERLAAVFDLQPWQLLVPGLDPKNAPTIRAFTATEKAFIEKVKVARDSIDDFLDQANTEPGDL